ncbi:MAG TPA: hypothetical protein VJ717_20720 [Gemmatimonadaceae bacterium]|nr:hypothetical protein [Gemmatimonadaceae bacterium]
MGYVAQLLVRLAVCLPLFTGILRAQNSERVALVVEPGLLTVSAISAPEGATPLTAFFLRAVVLVGKDSSRWKGVLGVSATPFGFRGSGVRNVNAPNVFFGVQAEVLPARLTDGWISGFVPVLVSYSHRGGRTENTRLYGADLAAEVTIILHVGRKLFTDLGSPWSRMAGYISGYQNLTPNADPTTGERDRFRPDFMYGVSIPIVGSR